jgi:hypothetical protein
MSVVISWGYRKERNSKCLRVLNDAARKGLIGKHPDIVSKPAFRPEDGFKTTHQSTF